MTPFYTGMQQKFITIQAKKVVEKVEKIEMRQKFIAIQTKKVEEKVDFIYDAVGVIFFIILIFLLSKYIKYIKKN
jgi:hypothetical protein